MRVQSSEWGTKIKASENDTYDWAHRSGCSWPCSELSGKRVFVELDSKGDLVDLVINGKMGDVAAHELNAFIEDALNGGK
ncbi:MAG: hypothetical protein ABIJ57_13825 [Pseudomonadota bacterium]